MGIKSEDTSPQMTAASSTASTGIPSVGASPALNIPAPWQHMTDCNEIVEAHSSVVIARAELVGADDGYGNARLLAAAPTLARALAWLLEHPACQASYADDVEMAWRVDRSITALLTAGIKLPDDWPDRTDGAAPDPSQGQAVQNLTDPASPSSKEER